MFVLSVNSKTARVPVLAAVGIVAEFIIPSEFDDTYKAYNEIQKNRALTLKNIKGPGSNAGHTKLKIIRAMPRTPAVYGQICWSVTVRS